MYVSVRMTSSSRTQTVDVNSGGETLSYWLMMIPVSEQMMVYWIHVERWTLPLQVSLTAVAVTTWNITASGLSVNANQPSYVVIAVDNDDYCLLILAHNPTNAIIYRIIATSSFHFLYYHTL